MIVNWAGEVEAFSVCKAPVTSVDFFPTILELAGGSPSDYSQLEGRSLLPLLYGQNMFQERSLYWHFPHHRKEGLSMGAAIRKGKWKYIYQFENEEEFIYDLEKDLGEQTNLVLEYPEKAKELSAELEKWQNKVNAEMPELNN